MEAAGGSWWAKWVVGLTAWLILAPASLVVVRALLPSDGLGPEETSGSIVPGAFVAAPPKPVLGIGRGDLILQVDGRPIDALLADPQARPVSTGDVHRYLVTEPDGSSRRNVAVTIRDGRDLSAFASTHIAMVCVFGLLTVVGGWLWRRRPGEAAAAALLLIGACLLSLALGSMVTVEPIDLYGRPWLALWSGLALPGFPTLPFAALWFALTLPAPRPDASHRIAITLLMAPAIGTTVVSIWQASGSWSTERLLTLDDAVGPIFLAGMLAAIVTTVIRWTGARHEPVHRRRVQLVGLGFAVSFVPFALLGTLAEGMPGAVFPFLLLPFLGSLLVAVARRDLFDLEVIVNRTLVATVAGGTLLAVYLVVVAATATVTNDSGPLVALPAAGVVAVSFAPVRDAVRRQVDRRLHGLSSDPRLLFHRLGMRLQAADDPDALAAALVETVIEGLRVPYASVEVDTDDGWQILDARGRRREPVEQIDVEVGGELIGRLVVTPRLDRGVLTASDRSLLEDLARHSGVALRVGALLAELRVAQQRLVVATEDERRRIQHDLHDGIGPILYGLSLQLSVTAEAAPDPELAAVLTRLQLEATRATSDVRRIVRNLAPFELEQIGLATAVQTAAARLQPRDGPALHVMAPPILPSCPPEVEEAAYLICLEAMNNAVRHSGASSFSVTLGTAASGELTIDASDDGCGIGEGTGDGTGMRSMRQRAIALGGTIEVRSDDAGTCIEVRLPRSVPT